jgi:hypothetical protein
MRNGLVVQGTPGRVGGDVPLAVQVPNGQVERFHFAFADTSDRWHRAVWMVSHDHSEGPRHRRIRQCGSFVGHCKHGRMRNGWVVQVREERVGGDVPLVRQPANGQVERFHFALVDV